MGGWMTKGDGDMSLTTKDFSTDRPAYLLVCKGYMHYADEPTEVTVTKVGRKLVTIRAGLWDVRYEVPEWDKKAEYFVEKNDYGEKNMLFPSMKAFNEWKERYDLLDWFSRKCRPFEKYTTGQLRAAKAILEGESTLYFTRSSAEWGENTFGERMGGAEK